MNTILSPAEIAEYRDRGFVVAKGKCRHADVERVKDSLAHAALRIAKRFNLRITPEIARDRNTIINEGIRSLYQHNRKAGGCLYDTINMHPSLAHFLANPVLSQVAADAVGVDAEEMIESHRFLMVHPAGENEKVLGWHQDSGYYPGHLANRGSVVLWIPLVDTDAKSGGLWVIPGSHKKGVLTHRPNEESSWWTRTREERGQNRMNLSEFDRDNAYQVEGKAGDIFIMDFNLVHMGAHNLGDHTRLTVVTRRGCYTASGYLAKYGPEPPPQRL